MNMRIFQELSSKHQFGLYTKELTHQVAQKNIIYIYIIYMQQTQLMAMITWAKKKFKQIYQYRAKGPMVLRLKYPPIWADLAEHANCYLLKKCCFLIFLQSPMQPQYVPLILCRQNCLNFFCSSDCWHELCRINIKDLKERECNFRNNFTKIQPSQYISH